MCEMTTEEKLKVIHSWTKQFDISLDRAWAKIVFAGTPRDYYEYTMTCGCYDDMIDNAYEIVNNKIWDRVCDPRFL